MPQSPHYTIFPISDNALTIDFGNTISEAINRRVLSLFEQIRRNPLSGMIEAVPAYSSLTIYYDTLSLRRGLNGQTAYDRMSELVIDLIARNTHAALAEPRQLEIPVCYDRAFAPDLAAHAAACDMTEEELIGIHTGMTYRVYMLGFLPGFAYMGEVDARIAAARKIMPAPVAAGSIGIAGRQTGIYPLASPGGWQIIGRTPLVLFDPHATEQSLLRAGDLVRFVSISKNEFANY